MKGKYLYGILEGNPEQDFSARGLFKKRPYIVNYNNIGAIVTDAPVKTYEADQEALLSHNRVLDEVMKLHTVLPMRFGTIARSEGEIKNLMRDAYLLLRERLSRIKDKVEFDMEVIIGDEQVLIKEVLNNNKEIRDLREKLISQGEGAAIGDKLLIGRMIAVEIARQKASLLKEIDRGLKPYYSRCKALAGKDVLSNFAFLVARHKSKEFESAIYKLGERYGDRLKFKYTGPLAPYNFVGLSLILINFEKVDTARKDLGLGEKATFNEIKDAYRKLAREYHPDTSPGDSAKEEEFKKIAYSYKLLSEYSRHYPEDIYEFKRGRIAEISIITASHE